MLTIGKEKFVELLSKGAPVQEQVVYAVRFIAHYVTFYKATFTVAYLTELIDGLPTSNTATILRFPGEKFSTSGLDLTIPKQRRDVMERLLKIKMEFGGSLKVYGNF